jgi:hypothetical protein
VSTLEDVMQPEAVFLSFVTAINRHEVPAMIALMAPRHIFVDSLGRRVEGAVSMETEWRGYLRCVQRTGFTPTTY